MVKPLSRKKRYIYLVFLTTAFLVCIPVLLLYSVGYQITDTFLPVKTGGAYVNAGISNARVFVDDEYIEDTGLLQKSVFVQQLKPRDYTIRVEKEGYQTWTKRLSVYENKVTESHALILPENIPLRFISPLQPPYASSATSTIITKGLASKEYTEARKLFSVDQSTSTSVRQTKRLATSSINAAQKEGYRELRDIQAWNDLGGVVVRWVGEYDRLPYYFCRDSQCAPRVHVKVQEKIIYFDFYPNRDDVLLVTTASGVYAVDTDSRSEHVIQSVYKKAGAEFRVFGKDSIYIKDGDAIYEME